jgi:hypothetical protein
VAHGVITVINNKYIFGIHAMRESIWNPQRNCAGMTDAGLRVVARELPRLRSLDLRNCAGVTAAGLQYVVRHLTELETLVLSGCPAVTDAAVPVIFRYHNPPHLRTLELRHCRLHDQGLAEVASYCPSLHKLDVRGCGLITADGLDALAQRIPHLTAFDGGWCVGVDDTALGHLARGYAGSLQHLDVEMCWRVTSAGIVELAQHCQVLQSLSARGCSAVDDIALAALTRSPAIRASLCELDISECDVGDEALEQLVASCRSLISVSVVGCPRITPARANRLARLAELKVVM